MKNIGIIFIVVLTSLVTSQHGSPLQKNGVGEILELLKREKAQEVRKQEMKSANSDSSSDEESANNSIYGLLKNMEVIDLIKQAKATSTSQDREEKKSYKHTNNPVYRNYENKRHRHSDTQHILEQLLQNKNLVHLNKEKRQYLTHNNLLTPITLEDDYRQDQTDADGASEYSKIIVILDPQAVKTSENRDALTNLLTRIRSLTSSSNVKHRHQEKYRRDYRESRDSGEDDYKPKRPRNDHGGGGGGGGGGAGRTAIPYIGQRGDIYEREN